MKNLREVNFKYKTVFMGRTDACYSIFMGTIMGIGMVH